MMRGYRFVLGVKNFIKYNGRVSAFTQFKRMCVTGVIWGELVDLLAVHYWNSCPLFRGERPGVFVTINNVGCMIFHDPDWSGSSIISWPPRYDRHYNKAKYLRRRKNRLLKRIKRRNKCRKLQSIPNL